jgi:hypothetical protein
MKSSSIAPNTPTIILIMNLKEQTIFFFTTFHTGLFNMCMHLISLPLSIYGFAIHDPLTAFGGLALEEIGHLYNHFYTFKGENRRKSLEIIPYQIMMILIFVIIMMYVFNWF